MGRSLDYIKERIDSETTSFTDTNFYKLFETNFNVWMKNYYGFEFKKNFKYPIYQDDSNTLLSEIVYNPKADFNYFTTQFCICDGTLLFNHETIKETLNNIFLARTVNNMIINPNLVTESFFNDKHFIYTLGDIVCGIEYDGDYTPKDKPWLNQRFTCMIPIKFEVVENERNI